MSRLSVIWARPARLPTSPPGTDVF